jgi:hypothetical protein
MNNIIIFIYSYTLFAVFKTNRNYMDKKNQARYCYIETLM